VKDKNEKQSKKRKKKSLRSHVCSRRQLLRQPSRSGRSSSRGRGKFPCGKFTFAMMKESETMMKLLKKEPKPAATTTSSC